MSTLVENVEKVKNAHAALKIAIESKGVAVPAGTKLTGMPALVDQIQTGGGGGGEDYGYLTFTAEQATTLTLEQNGDVEPLKLLKSTDAVNWTKWENPSTNGIQLNAGEHVYLKADEDAPWRTARSETDYNQFQSRHAVNCTGDIRSIVKATYPADYSYWVTRLFSDIMYFRTAPELPVINLTPKCYYYMFYNCMDLSQAPELPATTLAESCYSNMFNGCTYLNQAPVLPATNLADQCYSYMFRYCSNFTQAPELPATTLATLCYLCMFDGCSSLSQAPALPATEMQWQCYENMFYGCTSLKRIKMNASSGGWGESMFNGCTQLELVDMTGSTGVPQLSNVNNFDNTNDTYKIVVPDNLYDEWIAATNWSSIADHIMKQSDWNAEHPDDQL